MLQVGASEAHIFVGVGGPYFRDSNGDGHIDDQDTPAAAGARGFAIDDAAFALALLDPTDAADPSLYYALKASGSVRTVGMPAGIELTVTDLGIEVNGSTDSAHVVDFASSFPANADEDRAAGLPVLTGGAPIYLDFENRRLQVSASVQLTVFQQTLGGHFVFTKDNGNLAVSVSEIGLTLKAGGKTILELAHGTGSFQISDDGIVGQTSLDLVHGPDFGDKVVLNPAHFA